MKNLLLAFAFIGFISTSSFATKTILSSTTTTNVCGDDKKCDKKDCKHDTKECKDYKKASSKDTKKTSCEMKGNAKKACCSADKAKTCDKSKAATKEESKEEK
ncbi:MAG: hypothetical protein COX70_07400 [Flavobacteriales bacterium CG_4_10_14_0_2_um_filter_32_8]|nr:MAG: hypothetical protein COX70_07400 [Flavobacteriales bacterium CG_4_10_14_0_2_um_filter_32_8]PJB14973.1 MAG: hypothetical protein CO118_05800 [Flavobacteriales bacterium CG_4_9_14_3_um_filter_32_8]